VVDTGLPVAPIPAGRALRLTAEDAEERREERRVGFPLCPSASSAVSERDMMLLVVGCSFRTAPVGLRERLAFDEAKLGRALEELTARFDGEAVILSTCNRV